LVVGPPSPYFTTLFATARAVNLLFAAGDGRPAALPGLLRCLGALLAPAVDNGYVGIVAPEQAEEKER